MGSSESSLAGGGGGKGMNKGPFTDAEYALVVQVSQSGRQAGSAGSRQAAPPVWVDDGAFGAWGWRDQDVVCAMNRLRSID